MPEHTIAENLARLVNATTAIGNAITAKGGTVGANDGLEEFATDIATIPTQSNLQPVSSGATIYDFDGTVIATYTPEEFAALTEYPAHPTHEYLTADGYNWTLANAKAYSAKYGYVEVGAQYRVTDGKTRLFITLNDGRLEPQLGLGIDGSVDVDWGDGSAHDTMTGSAVGTTVYQVHKYARAGEYIITLTVTGNIRFRGVSNFGLILSKQGGPGNPSRVYLDTLKKILIGDNITTIVNYSFQSCYTLCEILIPKTVTAIGSDVFGGCYSLKTLIIPQSVTIINDSAFALSYFRSIVVPDTITSMGTSSVSYNPFLQAFTIPESVTSIAASAFRECVSLDIVTIPDTATLIRDSLLRNCYCLKKIIITDMVTNISGYAFGWCFGASYIKFKGTTTIPTIANITAWDGIPSDCYILVPFDYLDDYINTTNMPDDSTYLYLCYATYADGATLPAVDGDGYTLTWYASREDARAETNPISVGNGKEIYARGVEP